MSRTSRGGEEKQRSLKWISVKRAKGKGTSDEIVVNGDVKDEVFGPCAKDKCNLVSIFGAARQGKSFMMNCLAGKTGLFNISNLSEPCTQGIDISNSMIDLKAFSTIDGGRAVDGGKMKVGFVDAEGQGDQDITYDANLVCPILLTSKCVILNWKDSLQKDKILNHLGIMHKAAINVAMEGGLEDNEDIAIFGHLHFVFRDWQYQNSDEKSVLNDIFKEERSVETAAAVRNQIRRSIKDSFKSINVWLFPPPVSNATQLSTKLTFEIVEEPFRNKLRAFREVLSSQLKDPMKFAGKPLNGRKLGVLVETVADVLNSGETVSPQPAWISMSVSEVDSIRHKLEKSLRLQVDDFLEHLSSKCESCSSPDSSFVSKKKCDRRAEEMVAKFQEEYSDEVAYVVGALEGQLAEQVLEPSQELVDRIKSDAMARIGGGYNESLHKWLQTMVIVTQEATKTFLDEILLQLPMSEEALEDSMKSRCEHICNQSSLQIAEQKYGISASELEAISQQLTVYSNLLFEQYRQQNQKLLKNLENEIEEVIQTSLLAITDQVARTLVSFEISPQSEVLALKPKLKELDTIYFAQKKLLSRRVKDLFSSVSSMKDEKGDNMKAKGHADVMLKEAEARGIARLEEECSKMGTHLEAGYMAAAEKFLSASVSECLSLIEKESRQLVKKSDSLDIISTSDLRERFDELVESLIADDLERGKAWECPESFVETHQVGPLNVGAERAFEMLTFLNDQINESKKELLKARQEKQKREEREAEAREARERAAAEAKERAVAEAKELARQRDLEKARKDAEKAAEVKAKREKKAQAEAEARAALRLEEERKEREENQLIQDEAEAKAIKSPKKRRVTKVYKKESTLEVDESESDDDINIPKSRRRKTKEFVQPSHVKRRQTKLMSEEGVDSDSEMEVDEEEEEEEVVVKDTGGSNKRGRMTVEEQRASARRFAEANFTKTVKKTSEKKISKRRAKDVQEEEEEEEEEEEVEEEEAEVPKSLTKLQEAKLKQRELLAQRAKEKAEQIRSAKRRPSMAGKKR